MPGGVDVGKGVEDLLLGGGEKTELLFIFIFISYFGLLLEFFYT